MLVAGSRDECPARAVVLHQHDAEHAAVEVERSVEIHDLEVDVADPNPGSIGPNRLLLPSALGNIVRKRPVSPPRKNFRNFAGNGSQSCRQSTKVHPKFLRSVFGLGYN